MRSALLLIALVWLSTSLAEAAGIQRLTFASEDDATTFEGAVWSPCAAPPESVRLRRIEVPGVKDCPVAGNVLPLIVISHGARGWFGGHHDTAAALADAGYVVAAITHPDEPGRRWQTGRPASIKRLIDHMLATWPDRQRLDGKRIGFFGFSRGGYTGLVLIGGEPDFQRFVQHCRAVPSDWICQVTGKPSEPGGAGKAGPKRAFTHDSRIRTAVIAAPLGLVFSPEGLQDISVPLQLWRPENDVLASHPYNAEAVYQALPVKPDYRVVPNAGHFAIMAPCSAPMARAVPRICNDAPGFDRVAFHRKFNADILAFFRQHLDGS